MRYYLSPTHGPHVGDPIYPDDQEHSAEGFDQVAAAWYAGAEDRELTRIAARKAALVAEVHALREERFRRGFVHTDGHRYPLDLGAQTAFLGIDALVAKSIPVPINILTVDNQVVPMTAEEFSAFSLAAFAAGNSIVFLAREAKDRILAAETIEAAEAVVEAYREG